MAALAIRRYPPRRPSTKVSRVAEPWPCEDAATDMPKTAADVSAFVEEREIRFIRFWFTDVLGQLKSFSINAAELAGRVRGGDGLRRLLDHRLQRDRGVRHDRAARPRARSPCSRGAPRSRAWGGCSATSSPPSAPPTRAIPATCCAARWSARRGWASTRSTWGPSSSTSCSATRAPPSRSTAAGTST